MPDIDQKLGFPLHAVLATVPIGALTCATAFDVASRVASEPYTFPRPAFWLLCIGLTTGVVAGATALVGLLRLPRGTDAFRVGCWHVGLTDGALVLYLTSALLRRGSDYLVAVAPLALATSVAGWVLLTAGTVQGVRLTYRYGVGQTPPG